MSTIVDKHKTMEKLLYNYCRYWIYPLTVTVLILAFVVYFEGNELSRPDKWELISGILVTIAFLNFPLAMFIGKSWRKKP